jgi:XTP/dITP diphosphohydrolase
MALCFATNNEHKLEEVKALLPKNYPLLSLKDINCVTDLPETQETLQGNAHQKAFYVYQHFGVDCFADDTGLEVKSLGGAPGVYSARYAGPDRDNNANCSKLLQDLKGKTDRAARFRTVICLIKNGRTCYFEGAVSGVIELEMRGS